MMQALVLNQRLSYRTDVPQPVLLADEALIRLNMAGVCATDLELIKGYAGFSGIIGHEFVGVVEAVAGKQHAHWLGQRVVGSINIGCKRCEICIVGCPEHCLQRTVLGIRGKNGVFADYFTLPVSNLYAVPDLVTDEEAVFAEPLAAALRVVEQLKNRSVRTVAVLGPGRLGLLISKVLALAGYEVTVLGRSESSLALPKQWALSCDLISAVAENGYECVVDATGHAEGFVQALRIVKPRGILVLKSTFSASEPVDLSKVVVGEINVLGSRCGSFDLALQVLLQKTVAVETMIDARYILKNGLLALDHAARAGVRKVLLQP